MTQPLYAANPSVWRMRPFGTLIAWILILVGAYIAVRGQIPYTEQLLEGVQLPDWADPSYVGYLLVAWGLLQLLSWWVSARFDRLEITGKELIWTHGFLNKQYTETNMQSVRTVRVRQSLLQRLLNAGDVVIYTTGDDPELTIRGLPRPGEIRSLIKQQTPADA